MVNSTTKIYKYIFGEYLPNLIWNSLKYTGRNGKKHLTFVFVIKESKVTKTVLSKELKIAGIHYKMKIIVNTSLDFFYEVSSK